MDIKELKYHYIKECTNKHNSMEIRKLNLQLLKLANELERNITMNDWFKFELYQLNKFDVVNMITQYTNIAFNYSTKLTNSSKLPSWF